MYINLSFYITLDEVLWLHNFCFCHNLMYLVWDKQIFKSFLFTVHKLFGYDHHSENCFFKRYQEKKILYFYSFLRLKNVLFVMSKLKAYVLKKTFCVIFNFWRRGTPTIIIITHLSLKILEFQKLFCSSWPSLVLC